MSQENTTSKQPLIRYVNRQQMSWRAMDVEKLIGEDHPARAIWALVGRLNLSVEQRLKKKPQQMVADSGYTTRENIEKMAGREIDFLGTTRFENVPRGANLPNRFPPSAFLYQPERNCYVCPEGKVLHAQGRRKKGPGMIYHLYEARAEDCHTCTRKPECCPDNEKHGSSVARLEESPVVIAFRKKMASEEARERYRRRRIVEFCHARIKSKLGLRQFHVRGLAKAQMEMLWACLTYNLQHWIRLSKLRTTTALT